MNRRNFLTLAAAVSVAAILPTTIAAEPMRRLFWIDDGGELWHWSAKSLPEAMKMHVDLNYTQAGVLLKDPDALSIGECEVGDVLEVLEAGPRGETVAKSAAEWAADAEGMICTTCGY